MTSTNDILDFLLAGKAIFTLKSVGTGTRYTYKVSRKRDQKPGDDPVWFPGLLTGPDNTSSYRKLGGSLRLDGGGFPVYRVSGGYRDKTQKALGWLVKNCIGEAEELDPRVEFWHAGRCGMCGRLLTDPESIARGIGPVCAEKMR